MTDDEQFRGAEGRGESPGEELGEGYEWGEEPDITSISKEERAISYRRRVIQGRMELIRAELVRRGSVTLSPKELACVLLGEGCGRGVS